MQVSENGKKLIKQFESLKLTAYDDGGGVWTIGYGSTIINHKPVKKGDIITLEQANLAFDSDISIFQNNVLKLIKKPLNQNQFDSIISLVYNIGLTNFKKSTLLKKLNINPDDITIKDEFLKWKFDNGKMIQGLLNRRIIEASNYYL